MPLSPFGISQYQVSPSPRSAQVYAMGWSHVMSSMFSCAATFSTVRVVP